MALSAFTPLVRDWFAAAFEAPTPAQTQAWPAIATGENVLISAPTGSGKTLAAFLWGLDRFVAAAAAGDGEHRTRLRLRLAAEGALLRRRAQPARAAARPRARRGGARRDPHRRHAGRASAPRCCATPPDILITTPESLYLMLTSQAREILADVEAVIVDEIHAVAATKRGAHLALTLERLEAQLGGAAAAADRALGDPAPARGGRPLPGRPDAPCDDRRRRRARPLDLEIHVPVESMVEPDQRRRPPTRSSRSSAARRRGARSGRRSIRSSWSWSATHRSTIIFVNSRRAAERLALRLNELAARRRRAPGEAAPAEIARAHHGSLAREERTAIEELLKAGELPCLVATSSLELGIDMGAVDLVIQVESPKSVARGLQRIGRAGHGVGATSKGRIFPKFRADLLECAVVVRSMREGAIEPTVVPRNALDVLAQQIVAIARRAPRASSVDDLYALVTRTYSYGELRRELLENVLDMLDGRYPSSEFAELRPRIIWDRLAGTIRARKGAQQARRRRTPARSPTAACTPSRSPDGRRVGELDEEMVYEARPGQTFLLGASAWRIEEIGRDRVIVTPAPGAPGAVPFWRGDSVGRPKELGEAIGAFSRWARRPAARRCCERDYDLDRARRAQPARLPARAAGGDRRDPVRPHDRDRALPRRDRRLAPVRPLAVRRPRPRRLGRSRCRRRIRERYGLESDAIWSDDGIIVHLPDADEPPSAELVLPEPEELEELVVGELARLGAVRRALPRERGARAADPARLPGHSARRCGSSG